MIEKITTLAELRQWADEVYERHQKQGGGWSVVGSDRSEGPAFGLSLDTVPAGGSDLPADLGGFEPVGVR